MLKSFFFRERMIIKMEIGTVNNNYNSFWNSLKSPESVLDTAFQLPQQQDKKQVSEKDGKISSFTDTKTLYEILNSHAKQKREEAVIKSNLEEMAKEMQNKLSSNKYFELADNNGEVHYNGVTFQCDTLNQALCLGDMSDEKKVLTIPLSGGGSLKVNRDKIKSLSDAIGMFSPEDVKRILTAIRTDAKAKSKEAECEDKINKTFEQIADESASEKIDREKEKVS